MTKSIKVISAVAGLALLVFITAIILLVTFVNPNNFKNQINSVVQKNTGRAFAITGDIKWSFFPWLGLRVEQIALGNAPGFGQQPFAQVGEADVSVQFLPLFIGKVEMGSVRLKDLTLHLMKNSQGQNNWSDLAQNKSAANDPKATDPQPTLTVPTKTHTKIPDLSISNVEVTNATITWQDQQTGQTATISKLALSSKDINFGKAFPIKLKFNVVSNQPQIDMQIAANSQIKLDTKRQQYALQNLDLTGELFGKQYPHGKVPFAAKGNITTDLNQQTIDAKNLTASLANLKVTGNFNGSKILQVPVVQGDINVPSFNLKTFLTTLGQKVQTQDSSAMQSAALTAQTEFSPKYIKLNNLKADLDNTSLTGRFYFANLNTKRFDFDLKLNAINIDHYLGKTSTPQNNSNVALGIIPSAYAATTTNTTSNALPVKFLQNLNGSGNLQIDKLTISKLTVTNVSAQLTASEGLIKLAPFKADLYQGNSQGAIVLNARSATPAITANETLNNIQVGPLFNDLTKTSKIQITGVGNLFMNLYTQGQTADALIRALNGNITFSVKDGALKNIDIGQQIFTAIARVFKQNLPAPTAADQTNFSSLTGTVTINNGIATNNDLALKSDSLQVNGKGTANLINQTLDYQLKATALGDPFGRDILDLQQQIGGSIPIHIGGTFSDPKISPDLVAIAEASLANQAKQQIKKRLNIDVKDLNVKGLGNALQGLKGLLGN